MGLVPNAGLYALLEVFVFLAVADVLGSLGRKLRVPEIVVYLLLGIFLSSYALGGVINQLTGLPIFEANSYALVFADFSVILLLFQAGLGSGFQGLRAAGLPAILAAIAGDLVPFALTFVVLAHFYPMDAALLLGVAAAPTSAAVVAALRGSSRFGADAGGTFLMNTAALDDIVALVLFSIVLAIVGGQFDLVAVAGGLAGSVVVLVAILLFAVLLVPRLLSLPWLREAEGMPFLFLFAIVAVVVTLGFSAVIGAYIAGLAVAESVLAERTQRRTGFLLVLFGALFFVITGSQFDFHRFAELEVVGVGLAVTGIATVGKVVGVYPFARWSTGSDRAARTISLGMIPRGEIALVVGAAGFAAGILNEAEFGVILLLSIATTVIGSVLFRALAPAPGDGRTDRPAGGAGPSAASPGTVGPSQT